MRRTNRKADEAPGQDSFLDIVANLVGILIILVMIVGAQAKDALQQAELDAVSDPPAAREVAARQASNEAAAVRKEVAAMVKRVKQQQFEVRYRKTERDRLLTTVAEKRANLERQRAELDDVARREHDRKMQTDAAERTLQDLKLSLEVAEKQVAPVKVIKHRPTPLARTVFGKEVHFRLQRGRIAFVPLNELVDKFQAEARQVAHKLRQVPRVTDSVGPLGGFRLQYTLRRSSYSVDTRVGPTLQQRVELDHFVVLSVEDNLGERVDDALAVHSQFRMILDRYDSNQTTITVWVYPDSFDEYHRVKEQLYQWGYLTASRPMPDGQPISGSPNGTHSAAQ